MRSEEIETFQSIGAETGAVNRTRADICRCCFEESRDKTLDVAAPVDDGDAVVTDDDGEGVERCCADSDRVGGLEVEGLQEEGEKGGEFRHD